MLEVRNISKSFQGVKALKNVSAVLNDGEIHGIVGENGAGKSTLMKIVSGVYKYDSGEILIDGQPVSFSSPQDAYNAGIRIVHQELSLIWSLSIAENLFIHKVREGRLLTIVDRAKLAADARKLLADWGIDVDPRKKVSEISMGLRQMVEIARELSTNGKIIILDEPTSSLTEKEITKLFDFVRLLRSKGFIIAFISHRLNEVVELVDRITILRDGELIGSYKTNEMTADQVCRLIAGKEMSELYPKESVQIGDVVLEVKDFSGKGFSKVSFSVRKGEVFGIAGLMGSGRSELIRAIFGINKVDEGSVELFGQPVSIRSAIEGTDKGMALLSESRGEEGVFPEMNVANNLIILKLKEIISRLMLDKVKIKAKSGDLIKRFNIVTFNPQRQVISQLSGGNQQKTVFARLIGSKPKILLLDEPTRGVDVGNKAEIHKYINEFVKAGGTVLMVSSEIEEVIGISDRILVLNEGRCTGMFSRDGFSKEKIIRSMMGVSI